MKDFLGVVAICSVFVLAVVSSSPPKRHTPSLQVRVVGRDTPLSVSLPELVTAPAKYDGKLVRVVGMARFEFEGNGNALYLNRKDLEEGRTESAVYLTGLWPMQTKFARLDDHYVVVEAIFEASNRDHSGALVGSLREIRKIDENPYYPLK